MATEVRLQQQGKVKTSSLLMFNGTNWQLNHVPLGKIPVPNSFFLYFLLLINKTCRKPFFSVVCIRFACFLYLFGDISLNFRKLNGISCFKLQFKLEDSKESTSGTSPQPPTSPTNGTTQDPLKTAIVTASPRRFNSTESSSVAEKETPVAPNRSDDDKGELTGCGQIVKIKLKKEPPCVENDKENDNRSGPATQAMIQRRRRPKRRSTGVVHVDMEVSSSADGDYEF